MKNRIIEESNIERIEWSSIKKLKIMKEYIDNESFCKDMNKNAIE